MHPTLFHAPGVGIPLRAYGLLVMVGFLIAIFTATRRAGRVKANPDLVLDIGFVCLIFGILGARAFYVIHHWEDSFADKANIFREVANVCGGGQELYGGLLCATAATVLYMLYKRVSLRLYLDIVAPAVMLGLAFGRLGCFMHGCCWGGLCEYPWAVRFPYGSPAQREHWIDRRITVPANLLVHRDNGAWGPLATGDVEVEPEIMHGPALKVKKAKQAYEAAVAGHADAKEQASLKRKIESAQKRDEIYEEAYAPLTATIQCYGRTLTELRDDASVVARRSLPVHPTQVYSAIHALLLAMLLGAVFRWRKRHGVVFGLLITLYPITRIILETVRTDNALDTGGLTISQGVSVGVLAAAGLYWLWLMRQPLRSPKAVPYVPPPEKTKKKREEA